MAVVRELITRFAFNADTKKLKDFDNGIASLAKTAKIAAAAIAATAAAAFGFSNSAAKVGDELAKTSRTIGFGIDALQKYRFALGQLGVDQSALDASLRIFVRTLGQVAERGSGPALDTLKQLGVSIFDINGNLLSSEKLFRDVLKALSQVDSEARKSAFANDLFGRGSQALTLVSNINEVDRLTKRFEELGVAVTQDQASISEDFVDSMDELKRIIVSIKNEIGFALIPTVLKVVGGFKEWFIVNRDIIKLSFETAIQPIQSVFKAVSFLIIEVIKGFNDLNPVVQAAIIAFGALGFAFIAPWIPLVGAITLATLAIDDFVNFFQGNDSIVGRVLQSWRNLLDEIIRLINKIPGINIRTRSDRLRTDELLTPGASERLRALEQGNNSLLTQSASERLGMLQNELSRNIGNDVSRTSVMNSSRSIMVDSTVNVSVPDGTPREIRESAREQGRLGAIEGFNESMNRILRQTQNEFPLVE